MPATISHALSMTTPDDPLYENRPSHWNQTHVLTLNATGSEISGAFSNANGLSFGLSAGAVTGSYTVPTVPAQLSAGNSNLGNTVGDTGVVTGRLVLVGSNNVTLSGSTNAGSMTISISARGVGTVSGGTTNATVGALSLADSNGISFGIDGQTVTAQHNALTTAALSNHSHGDPQLNLTNLSGTTASNSAGFTLSLSANAGGGAALSAGTQSVNTGTVVFADSNGITFGMSGSSQITASHNGLTSQSNQAFSADASSTFQTLTFQNSNGFTFSNNAGAIRASYTVPVQSNGILDVTTATQSGTATSRFAMHDHAHRGIRGIAAVGTASTFFGDFNLSGGNGVTLITGGNSTAGSVGFSVANQSNQQMTLFATGNTTLSSTGTSNASSLIFRGSGAASIGITNGSVLIDVAAGAAAITQSIGMSTQTAGGATAGTTGYVTGDDVLYHFVPGSNITMSQSVNGASGTLTIYGPAAGGGATISSYENMPGGLWGTSAVTFGATSLSSAVAFQMPQAGSFSFLRIPVLMTMGSTTIATIASATASAQMGQTSTFNAVVYSLGTGASSKSLISVASGSGTVNLSGRISISNSTQGSYTLAYSGLVEGGGTTRTTQYSVSNTNYSFTSQAMSEFSSNRFLDIPFANSLSPGMYWLVVGRSTSSSSAGAALSAITSWGPRYSNHYAGTQGNLIFAVMGSTNQTSGGLLGAGVFSTAGGGTTSGFPISAISSTASNPRMYFQLLRSA